MTALWRHPLKAHGREALNGVTLVAGQSMPYDRTWAVAHDTSKAQAGVWAACNNFTRGAAMPQLQAITATLDEATEMLTLRHPDMPELTFHPDHDTHSFLEWVAPLCPDTRAQPADIIRLDGRGYTDSHIPSISVMNAASHHAVEAAAGTALDTTRWRGNIWIDGARPWEEFEWIGHEMKLGQATVRIDDAYTRCTSIDANPRTGTRDIDLLAVLNSFGHQKFGIGMTVLTGGDVRIGDKLELI